MGTALVQHDLSRFVFDPVSRSVETIAYGYMHGIDQLMDNALIPWNEFRSHWIVHAGVYGWLIEFTV